MESPTGPMSYRLLLSPFAAVVMWYAAFTSVLSPDRLMLFPTTDPVDSAGATRRFVPLGAGRVEVWTARSARCRAGVAPEAYVLRFYGMVSRADSEVAADAREWASPHAVEFWGVNYPGFGGSTGLANLADIAPAARAGFDALRAASGTRPILVFGTSIGTTAALHVAAHRPVAGVILQNPPPIREIVLRQFGWWNLWLVAGPVAWHLPTALDSLANARAVQAPGVFVLSGKDRIVAPRFQRLVVDAYAGNKRLIPMPQAAHDAPIVGEAREKFYHAVDWLLANPPPRTATAPSLAAAAR